MRAELEELRADGRRARLAIEFCESDGRDAVIRHVLTGIHAAVRAIGLERIEKLGLRAVVFPALGTSEDAAMLLADSKGASLIVAVGTVKAHVHAICGKLGASNRVEAIAKARELEVLA